MSNCKQIVTDIQTAIRHAPNVEAEREELIRRINRKQRILAAELPWSWLQRVVSLRMKAEVDVSNTYTVGGASGDYSVQFAIPSSWDSDIDVPNLAGQIASFSGVLSTDYVIEQATYSTGIVTIWMDPRYTGSASLPTPTASPLKIKFLRYRLPGDLTDAYNFMLRDDKSGPMHEITLDQEQDLMLNDDDGPGIPDTFMLSPNRPRSNWDPSSDYQHIFAEPPHAAMASTNAAGGALPNGSTWEYRYCWVYGGLVSGFSETIRVVLGATEGTVSLSDLEVVGSAPDPYGRVKYLFRRQVLPERMGPWYKLAELPGNISTYTDAGSFSAFTIATVTRERDWPAGDVTRFVRFWPLTDQDRAVELRYMAQVRDLVSDLDEPELPEFAHDLLVHAVVMDLAAESDAADLTRHHAALYKHLHRILRRRQLASAATIHRKGSIFGGGRSELRFKPATWNG